MPSKIKKLERDVGKLPSIPKELVNQFLSGPMTGEAINAAGLAFKQALIEASLNAELTHHLGYAPGAERPEAVTNQRNGVTSKTVLTGDGKLRIETPRDRAGSFEPLLVPKHASFHRVRRQHRRAVRARPDSARDPGLSARNLRHRGRP
jgi:transposase-like protein